ncbi:hypothetical protein VTJ83DRAFT_1982 [Remersonia thermophila]|uniref:Integral membrane protein n=1 Tax=Remersonia thermophila TaxID=72144 RepID=A0ABR4DHG6_9PEZI
MSSTHPWSDHWSDPSVAHPAASSTPHDDADPDGFSSAALPDEHTRLLPNRINSEPRPRAYLSPSDPAVSPYNLWTVRFLRGTTVALFLAAVAWWLVLVVATFVTPPGLHVRGSPFLALAYASLALLTLAVSLLFFAAPSRSARALGLAAAGLLAADAAALLAAPGLRRAELWPGVASAVWAAAAAAWSAAVGKTVKWGKAEEERRLTGRPETRRSVAEWGEVVLATAGLGVVAAAAALVTANLVLRAADGGLAPPGERYWVDGGRYRVHLYCSGNATDPATGARTTTLLLEGGEDPVEQGLWQFAENAVRNGSIRRFCFADRPGMAWSDAAPSPFSASTASDTLSEALSRAGEQGPWILASAGIGSLYSRVFSSRHGDDVRGLLLIDPLHEDLLGRVGSPGRGFLLWARGVASPCGVERLLGAVLRGRSAADRVWGRSWRWSGKALFSRLQESLVAESLTRRDVVSSRAIQDEATPLVVVSSGKQLREDREWEDKQRDLTHLTRNLLAWDIVQDAPHRVWDSLEGRQVMEKRLRGLVRDARSQDPASNHQQRGVEPASYGI